MELKTSESIENLAKAMIVLQANLKPATRNGYNPHFKSKFAMLDDVWDACREALKKAELAVMQPTAFNESGDIGCTTILIHKSGEFIQSTLLFKPDAKGPQKAGACITYARRYSLAAILGIIDDDDLDGAQLSAKASGFMTDALNSGNITKQQFNWITENCKTDETVRAAIQKIMSKGK